MVARDAPPRRQALRAAAIITVTYFVASFVSKKWVFDESWAEVILNSLAAIPIGATMGLVIYVALRSGLGKKPDRD